MVKIKFPVGVYRFPSSLSKAVSMVTGTVNFVINLPTKTLDRKNWKG